MWFLAAVVDVIHFISLELFKWVVCYNRFPLYHPRKLKKWLTNMKWKDWTPSRFSALCINHFEEQCIDRTGKCVKLKQDAVPTIFPPPDDTQKKVCTKLLSVNGAFRIKKQMLLCVGKIVSGQDSSQIICIWQWILLGHWLSLKSSSSVLTCNYCHCLPDVGIHQTKK